MKNKLCVKEWIMNMYNNKGESQNHNVEWKKEYTK